MVQTGCDQLVDTLLIGWWEVSRSQHHEPSGPVVLGPMCLWAPYGSLLPPGGGFRICKTA